MRDDAKITDYFLGKLSSQDAEQFERQCISDSKFADSAFVVEDELIDRYVRNELSREERKSFEEYYLTTEARRSRVEMARSLNRTIDWPATASDHGFWQRLTLNRNLPRYALATLAVLLVITAVWLVIKNSNKQQIAQINPPQNVASPEITPATTAAPTQNPTETPAGPEPSLATVFTLFPGRQREAGAGETLIKLAPQTKSIELRFVIDDRFESPYEIRIETAEGENVLVRRGVTPVRVNQRQVLVLRAPASAFAARDYVSRVIDRNGDTAPSYTFRVTK